MSKVLIASADTTTLDTWISRASAAGHEVYVAYDGLDAVDMAYDLRPDIVLLDALMPQLTGKEVAARLNANPEYRFMKGVIVMPDTETERHALRLLGIVGEPRKAIEPRVDDSSIGCDAPIGIPPLLA